QAPTLFTLAQDLTKMQVAADVSESDIGTVKVGQPVRFNVDAYPDRDFRGRVSQIRLNATVNQNVVTYPVVVEVGNPDLTLRPSMTANVSIEVARARDVLRIPNAALRWKPEAKSEASTEQAAARLGQGGGTAAMARQVGQSAGGRSGNDTGRRARGARAQQQTVYKLPPGKEEPAPVEVRTGISDGRFTQVVEGQLAAGDTVVTGAATLKADTQSGAVVGGARGGRRGF
ncbi:MAG TPA: efflux RND transporter periplasmic adaptor subunit, partial [Patescibacteria group bacterium]|nr:efflux RND transporter periplasmic adaptor subunit [Patescibacteria group bacterium]